MGLAAKQKPVVVIADENPWSAPTAKSLKAKYQVKLEAFDSEDEACMVHSAVGVVTFAKGKGKKPGALKLWSCEEASTLASYPLKGKPSKKGALPAPVVKKLLKAMPKAKPAPNKPVMDVPEETPKVAAVETVPSVETAPPVASTPTEDDTSQNEQEEPAPPTPKPVASKITNRFGVFATGRLLQRQLRYTEGAVAQMSTHSLSAGPYVGADLEAFPSFLAFTENVRIGVRAHYSRILGVDTANADRTVVLGTSAQDVRATLVVSLKFGSFFIEPQAGFSQMSFQFIPSEGVSKGSLANVDYRAVRAGARMGIELGEQFSIMAEGNYRYLLSVGELGTSFYPNWRGMAFDASVGPTVRIASGLEARLVGELFQSNLNFTTEPSDTYQARGSADRFLGASLQLGWFF